MGEFEPRVLLSVTVGTVSNGVLAVGIVSDTATFICDADGSDIDINGQFTSMAGVTSVAVTGSGTSPTLQLDLNAGDLPLGIDGMPININFSVANNTGQLVITGITDSSGYAMYTPSTTTAAAGNVGVYDSDDDPLDSVSFSGAAGVTVNSPGDVMLLGSQGTDVIGVTGDGNGRPVATGTVKGQAMASLSAAGTGTMTLCTGGFDHANPQDQITVSGTAVNLGPDYIQQSLSSLNILNGGIVTSEGSVSVQGSSGPAGVVNINTGGRLITDDSFYARQWVNNGTLEFAAGVAGLASSPLGSGQVQVDSGATMELSSVNLDLSNQALTICHGGTLLVSGGQRSTLTGTVANDGTFEVSNNNELDMYGAITGDGSGEVVASSQGQMWASGSISGQARLTEMGGNLIFLGPVAPGTASSTGVLTCDGGLTLDAGTSLNIRLNGDVAGTSYDQVVVVGRVNLNGGALSITQGQNYSPAIGDSYTVIQGATAINGTFAGVAEGAIITLPNGAGYEITYQGGHGRDVNLTYVGNMPTQPTNLTVGTDGSGNPTLSWDSPNSSNPYAKFRVEGYIYGHWLEVGETGGTFIDLADLSSLWQVQVGQELTLQVQDITGGMAESAASNTVAPTVPWQNDENPPYQIYTNNTNLGADPSLEVGGYNGTSLAVTETFGQTGIVDPAGFYIFQQDGGVYTLAQSAYSGITQTAAGAGYQVFGMTPGQTYYFTTQTAQFTTIPNDPNYPGYQENIVLTMSRFADMRAFTVPTVQSLTVSNPSLGESVTDSGQGGTVGSVDFVRDDSGHASVYVSGVATPAGASAGWKLVDSNGVVRGGGVLNTDGQPVNIPTPLNGATDDWTVQAGILADGGGFGGGPVRQVAAAQAVPVYTVSPPAQMPNGVTWTAAANGNPATLTVVAPPAGGQAVTVTLTVSESVNGRAVAITQGLSSGGGNNVGQTSILAERVVTLTLTIQPSSTGGAMSVTDPTNPENVITLATFNLVINHP